jgi:hypothetical protein
VQICQLSKSEFEKMQHLGFVPDCHSHAHLSKRDAEQAYADGRVKRVSRRAVVVVGPPPGSEYWYDKTVRRNDRYVAAARSGAVRTMQLVNFMPRAKHKVYGIGACGAHGCSMTAKAVNETPHAPAQTTESEVRS